MLKINPSLLSKNMVAQHSPCINNHKVYENKKLGFQPPFNQTTTVQVYVLNVRQYKTENWSLVTWHWQSAFYNDKSLAKQQKSAHKASLLFIISSTEQY